MHNAPAKANEHNNVEEMLVAIWRLLSQKTFWKA